MNNRKQGRRRGRASEVGAGCFPKKGKALLFDFRETLRCFKKLFKKSLHVPEKYYRRGGGGKPELVEKCPTRKIFPRFALTSLRRP